MHGLLTCTAVIPPNDQPAPNSKPKEMKVFLFEQSIIFSEAVGKNRGKFTEPVYVYKAHVQVCILNLSGYFIKKNNALLFCVLALFQRKQCWIRSKSFLQDHNIITIYYMSEIVVVVEGQGGIMP